MKRTKWKKGSGIYRIFHKESGKMYVGSAMDIASRFKGHKISLNKGSHHSRYLQNAGNKHGAGAFAFEIVERCSTSALLVREQYWLDHFQSYRPRKGYNVCPVAGNCLGVKRNLETRKKLSEIKEKQMEDPIQRHKMGKFWREADQEDITQAKQKLRQANLGKKYSEESKLKRSLTQKGKPKEKAQRRTSEERVEIGRRISMAVKGIPKPKTKEHCQNVVASRRANGTDKHSEETKEKIRQKKLGTKLSEETKAKMSTTHKARALELSTFWKQHHKKYGHPKGMLGKEMSEATRTKMRFSQQTRRQLEKLAI